jgi:hypothetical protein
MMQRQTIRIIAMVVVVILCLSFIAGWDTALAQQVWAEWLVRSPLELF